VTGPNEKVARQWVDPFHKPVHPTRVQVCSAERGTVHHPTHACALGFELQATCSPASQRKAAADDRPVRTLITLGSDELGNCAEVSPDCSSSPLQKSRSITRSSAKDHWPDACNPYIPIAAEMTGRFSSPKDDLGKRGGGLRGAGRSVLQVVPRGSDRPCQFAVVRVYGSHTSGTSMLPRSAVSRGTSENVARRTEPTSRCSSPARLYEGGPLVNPPASDF
jgi:hypothetical protein